MEYGFRKVKSSRIFTGKRMINDRWIVCGLERVGVFVI